jgi:ribose transport system permease protein
MSSVAANIAKIQRRGPILQIVVLVLLFLFGKATITGFAGNLASFNSLLVLAALLGLAAAGQTFVIILMGLDLSVPGFIVGGAVLISELCGAHGWPFVPAVLLAIVLAGLLGGTSGWICQHYRVQPLIVTLGMSSLVLGISLVATGGKLTGSAPAFLSNVSSPTGTTFGMDIPPVVVIWVIVTLILAFVLYRTPLGRRIYATGANPRAAGIARVPVAGIWTGVFAFSAISSALVGVLLAGFAGADQTIGDPYLFTGLTAVIVGGVTFGGAHGGYTHTAIGALILTVLTTILVGNGLETADQQIIYGLLILVVVAGYGRDRRVQDRI